jgi:uncharacterized repeat protein (TIGR03803 family)
MFAGPDGSEPAGGLILASDGNFYGITSGGGPTGNGTVFRFTPAGVLTTLHNFSSAEAIGARGTLLQASDGNFYGCDSGPTGLAAYLRLHPPAF